MHESTSLSDGASATLGPEQLCVKDSLLLRATADADYERAVDTLMRRAKHVR